MFSQSIKNPFKDFYVRSYVTRAEQNVGDHDGVTVLVTVDVQWVKPMDPEPVRQYFYKMVLNGSPTRSIVFGVRGSLDEPYFAPVKKLSSALYSSVQNDTLFHQMLHNKNKSITK